MLLGHTKAVLFPASDDDQGRGAALQVIAAHAGNAERWDGFVSSQPRAALGHLFAWKRVFESSYGKSTHYLMALEKNEVAGVLPLVHMRGLLGGNRLVSLPFLDQAGILAASAAAAEALQAAALRLARGIGATWIDLRSLAIEGEHVAGRSTLVLRLPPDTGALWRSFSTKVRNQVRKAEKEALRTEPASRDHLCDFYEVFSRNMRDLGSPVHSRKFFESVLAAFDSQASLYLTVAGTGRVIGGGIALRSGGTVTVPWASSLRECFASCPNHSLYWKILTGAIDSGANDFDFGRSHEDSGTYRFKRQWGAEPRPLGWTSFDPDGRPGSESVLRPGDHRIITNLWRRLPIGLANFLGPLLRRQLSN